MATQYGNFGGSLAVTSGTDVGVKAPNEFGQTFMNYLSNQPIWMGIQYARDQFIPTDPEYSLTSDSLKGYEAYATDFVDVRSKDEELSLKARIDATNERRADIAENGNFWVGMASELVNPVNLIPLPGIAGAGFIKGMIRSAAGFGATLAGEELLRQGVDPTSTTEESVDNFVYGTLFGSVVGGGIGLIGAKEASRLGRQYDNAFRRLEGLDPHTGTDGAMAAANEGDAVLGSQTQFTAKPSEGIDVGPAPVIGGLEKATRMTLYGKLKSYGIRAIEDIADALAGEFGILNARNRQGLKTEDSAYLASSIWNAHAADAISNFQKAFSEYRIGVEGSAVLDMNMTATAIGAADLAAGLVNRAPTAGKMTYDQFMDEVFRSIKDTGIETDNPFVRKAAEAQVKFLNTAAEDGVKTGFIRTNDNLKNALKRKTQRSREMIARYDELTAKPDLSINEKIELSLMDAQFAEMFAEFEAIQKSFIDEESILAKINEIEQGVKDNAGNRKLDIEATILKRKEEDLLILSEFEQTIASGKQLSNRQKAYYEMLKGSTDNIPGSRTVIDFASRPDKIDGIKVVYGPTGKRAMATYRRNENTIYFDLDGLLASWKDKPWSKPKVPGVQALDDADFPTPEAWAEFVMRHELAHTRVDRFEKAKLNIYPTKKDVIRLFNLGDGRWTDDFDKAIEAVGSVDDVRYVDIYGRSSRKSDVKSPGGKAPSPIESATDVLNKRFEAKDGDIYVQKTKGDLKSRGFTTDVKAQYENAMNGIAINEMRRGVSPGQRTLINKLDEAIKDPRAAMTSKQLDYIKSLEEKIDSIGFDLPEYNKFYLPRFWSMSKIAEDEVGLRNILEKYFTENPLPGASMTLEAISNRVDEAMKNIKKEAELGDMQTTSPGEPFFTKKRRLDIPNELVADYIETNLDQITRTYAKRFGIFNEYTRKFGDADARDAIRDTLLQSAREMNASSLEDGLSQVDSLQKEIENLRDTVTGARYSSDPLVMNARKAAAGIKAYGSITALGGSALSAIVEVARPLMVHGFSRTFNFAFEQLMGNLNAVRGVSKEMRALTGEALDTVLGTGLQRDVDISAPVGISASKAGRALDKGIDFARGPYYIANLLSPVTDLLKRVNLTMTAHYMLEDIAKVADGTANKKLITNLAGLGIDVDMAKRINAQPFEKLSRLNVPNMAAWTDDGASRAFGQAATGMSRRLVVTPGPGDLPDIAKGFVGGREFPLLTLPFHLMNYGFAATNKLALSALQGRDANPIMGAAAMIGMGGVIHWLKSSNYAYDKMTADEKLMRAVEISGVLGTFSDINNTIETASLGQAGIRPALGMRPIFGNPEVSDIAGELGGVGISRATDLAKLVIDGDPTRQEIASTIRRSIPLNDLFYWKSAWKSAEKNILDATE